MTNEEGIIGGLRIDKENGVEMNPPCCYLCGRDSQIRLRARATKSCFGPTETTLHRSRATLVSRLFYLDCEVGVTVPGALFRIWMIPHDRRLDLCFLPALVFCLQLRDETCATTMEI